MAKYKDIFYIKRGFNSRNVYGLIYKGFGIHKAGKLFDVIHLESGIWLACFWRLKTAKFFIDKLLEKMTYTIQEIFIMNKIRIDISNLIIDIIKEYNLKGD